MRDVPEIDFGRVLAANVRRMRRHAGLSQEELAQRADMSPQHLSTIERNQCSPRVETVVKLAECLDVNPGKLFDASELLDIYYLYTDLSDATS